MKLFFKDHIGFIGIFLLNFVGIFMLLDMLESVEQHRGYFFILTIFFLVCFLGYRYVTRRQVYKALQKENRSLDSMTIYNPHSALERAFDQFEKSKVQLVNEERMALIKLQSDYKIFINQSVHQMKTPLAVMSMIIEDSKIKEEIDKVNYYLEQTLSFLRLDQIQQDITIQKVPLEAVIKEVVNDLKSYFIQKQVYPKIIIDEKVEVYTDKKWLICAMYQIINNAIKYSDVHKQVVFEVVYREEHWQLGISNEGIGIASYDRSRIFELFYTGENGRCYGESTGVGLYITKNIIDFLGHKITVESVPEQRTTFWIIF